MKKKSKRNHRLNKLKEIEKRCIKRKRYPKFYRSPINNEQNKETRDYNYLFKLKKNELENLTRGERKLLKKIQNWKKTKFDILKEIENRCLNREKLGKHKYPKQIINAKNEEEKREYSDNKFLSFQYKQLKKFNKKEKILFKKIQNWKKTSSILQNLKEIEKRCLNRQKLGKNVYPTQGFKIKNHKLRNNNQQREASDCHYLSRLSKKLQTMSKKEKKLFQKINNWKVTKKLQRIERLKEIEKSCLERKKMKKSYIYPKAKTKLQTIEDKKEYNDHYFLYRNAYKIHEMNKEERKLFQKIQNYKTKKYHFHLFFIFFFLFSKCIFFTFSDDFAFYRICFESS